MQILGLYITLVPSFKKESLSRYMGIWVPMMSLLSLILVFLSVVLYAVAGPAWSNLLGFFSNACLAFVVLQLIRGLQAERYGEREEHLGC